MSATSNRRAFFHGPDESIREVEIIAENEDHCQIAWSEYIPEKNASVSFQQTVRKSQLEFIGEKKK